MTKKNKDPRFTHYNYMAGNTDQNPTGDQKWLASQEMLHKDPIKYYSLLIEKRGSERRSIEERINRAQAQLKEIDSKLEWAKKTLNSYQKVDDKIDTKKGIKA